mmetsp:Transcript_79554/g.140409  ORF Transcript_79554/g.140409 Transcript_79554/m.140409 type:complete len:237 (-) Transcript_79554:97-807(-)
MGLCLRRCYQCLQMHILLLELAMPGSRHICQLGFHLHHLGLQICLQCCQLGLQFEALLLDLGLCIRRCIQLLLELLAFRCKAVYLALHSSQGLRLVLGAVDLDPPGALFDHLLRTRAGLELGSLPLPQATSTSLLLRLARLRLALCRPKGRRPKHRWHGQLLRLLDAIHLHLDLLQLLLHLLLHLQLHLREDLLLLCEQLRQGGFRGRGFVPDLRSARLRNLRGSHCPTSRGLRRS